MAWLTGGSSCVVPSLEKISPPICMKNLAVCRYVLLRQTATIGQMICTLCSAVDLFIQLKASDVSINKTVPVCSSSEISRIACTAC